VVFILLLPSHETLSLYQHTLLTELYINDCTVWLSENIIELPDYYYLLRVISNTTGILSDCQTCGQVLRSYTSAYHIYLCTGDSMGAFYPLATSYYGMCVTATMACSRTLGRKPLSKRNKLVFMLYIAMQ